MSWFTEIAGKAEDFLNKIDQNAAVALNALEEHTQNRRSSKTWVDIDADTIKSDQVEDLASLSQASTTGGITSYSHGSNNNFRNDTGKVIGTENGSAQSSQPLQPSKILQSQSRSRPRSKPKQVESSSEKSSKDGSLSASNSAAPPATDDQLLEFLNMPSKKEAEEVVPKRETVDENALLKNELAAHAREMGMLLKNHKALQQEYDAQKKVLDGLREDMGRRESQLSSQELDNRQELERVRMELKEKDKELNHLREHLDEALEKLKKTDSLIDLQNRVEHLELENRKVTSRNVELEGKLQGLNEQLLKAEKQSQGAKEALLAAENEFSIYKEKAKSILRSKDELISSIKNDARYDVEGRANDSQIMAEIQSLRNERELLHGEVSQSRVLCESLKEENHRLVGEIQQLRANFLELQDSCSRERVISHTIEEDNLQLSQKVSALKLELERERSEKRKMDERLKKVGSDTDLVSRTASGSPVELGQNQYHRGSSYSPAPSSVEAVDERENLKTRIKALSHALMEKQTLINNISGDKQLLQIRVERLQAQIDEMNHAADGNHNGGLTQTIVSTQPLYLSESPWDSNVATKVKRVYSRVDSLCCQFGLAMRHRPNLRLGFSLYILLLHLWVFFILFYWSHSSPIPHNPNPYRR